MAETAAALAQEIERRLEEPRFFAEILEAFADWPYRSILEAWSDVRIRRPLARDVHGRYWLETADGVPVADADHRRG